MSLIFFLIRKSPSEDDIVDEEEDEFESPIAGPPATAFAGPPATSQVQTTMVTEYEIQVEEYNRKMAEYEAWQAAQGSQAVVDSTVHE